MTVYKEQLCIHHYHVLLALASPAMCPSDTDYNDRRSLQESGHITTSYGMLILPAWHVSAFSDHEHNAASPNLDATNLFSSAT